MRPLVLNATELLRQPGTVRRIEKPVELDELDVADDRLAGEVAIDLRLESTLDDIVVTGTLAVRWSDACRRCLRPLDDTLRIDVEERTEAVNGQLDLTALVRDELLLGPPDAPLCRPDCPGLCPTCGADRTVDGPDRSCDCVTDTRDERWAVLDVLKDNIDR